MVLVASSLTTEDLSFSTNLIRTVPFIDDWIDSLGETTAFSTLDVTFAYWQIDINEREKD